MYLIESESDNSLVIVNKSQLLADVETVMVADSVNYIYGKRNYTGIVKFISDDDNEIKSELNNLKNQKKKVSHGKSEENNLKSGVRKRSRRSTRSEDNESIKPKKSKVLTPTSKETKKKVQRSSTSESSDVEEVEEYNDSTLEKSSDGPLFDNSLDCEEETDKMNKDYTHNNATKEAEEKALKIAEKEAKEKAEKDAKEKADKEAEKIASKKNKDNKKAAKTAEENATKGDPEKDKKNKSNAKDNSSDDDSSDSADDSQLIGADEPHMKHIGHGIYCQRKICKNTVRGSSAATHVARKLLEGVFKPATLLKCTISGKPATAQGKERQQEAVVAMNSKAKKAIIDFALKTETEHNWRPSTREKVISSMSQKLVEIKAVHRKNQKNRSED